MSEAPLANSPEARTPTGEIKDPSALAPTGTPTTTPAAPETTNANPAAAAGPPEAYAEYRAPEGFRPDPEAVSAANTIFRELGLDQSQAQKLMDLQFAREAKAAASQQDAIKAMHTEWEASLKSDPAIGGKLDTVKTDIGRALAHVDTATRAEFQRTMDETGMGNNPSFVKTLYALAQKVNEGQHVQGQPAVKPAQGRPSAATALYPHLAATSLTQ